MVTKLQVDYLVRARQLALTGHYPHLTDLHQVLYILMKLMLMMIGMMMVMVMMVINYGGDTLTGHYPHLTDLHQVLDLDETDVDGDCDDDWDDDGGYKLWW